MEAGQFRSLTNNHFSDSQRFAFSVGTQWGRLIACLPYLESVGENQIILFGKIQFIYWTLSLLDLIEPSLVLGRSDECDIVIHKSKFSPDQIFFISKKHFVIRRDSDDKHITYITDLSKNGTYVNNQLIGKNKTIILQNNDLLAIGEKLVGKFLIN